MKLSWTGIAGRIARNQPAGRSWAGFLLPSLQDVLFLALCGAVIVLGPRLLNMDGDLGRHLTIGGYILDSGRIPTRDLFSHTRYGSALTPHEWLAAVVFSGAYRLAGLDGVVVLCALLIAVTFTLVYNQCLERSGQVLIALGLTLLAAAATSLHWLARPHLFTLLLVVVWVEVLERLRTGRTSCWWLLPALMLAWANLHGAFLAGFFIWGVYLLGEILNRGSQKGQRSDARLRLILAGGLAALAVTWLNPAGWRLWETSLGFLSSSYLVNHTAEYFSPNFHLKSSWPFLGMLVLNLLLFGFNRKRLPVAHILLIAGWTSLALVSARNIPLYAALAAPVLAAACALAVEPEGMTARLSGFQSRLAQVEQGLSGHLWPLLGIALLALGLVICSPLGFSSQRNQFDPRVFPIAAINWLESQPDPGLVFNYFPWGGYLLYRLWPDQRVFIDGQTDFYGEYLTREYEQVITVQPGWAEELERYGVRWVIMPPEADLIGALKATTDWQVRYEDDTAAILFAGH